MTMSTFLKEFGDVNLGQMSSNFDKYGEPVWQDMIDFHTNIKTKWNESVGTKVGLMYLSSWF